METNVLKYKINLLFGETLLCELSIMNFEERWGFKIN